MFCRNSSVTEIIGQPCKGSTTINIPSVKKHAILYTSSIIRILYNDNTERYTAIIGETDKLGLISKSRIDRIGTYPQMQDDDRQLEMNDENMDFEIRILISGQNDEMVSLSWMDSFNTSSINGKADHRIIEHKCVIGRKMHASALFIIRFPFNEESFAECY